MQQFARHLKTRIELWLVALARAFASESGNAIVELALGITFLLAPLMLGTVELGFMVYDSIEVSNAAHAGAVYGSHSDTFSQDANGILAIARSEAGDLGTNLSAPSTTFYACSQAITGTRYSTQNAAAAVCPTNAANHWIYFVQVNTSATVTPPVRIPGLPPTWTLTGTSVMEVPQP